MNSPAHSRSYKLAKWQLARHTRARPIKHAYAISLVLSLFSFGTALLGGTPLNTTLGLLIGVMWLFVAYLEWVLIGYREIIEEQAKLLGESLRSKASDLPPTPANAA